MRSLAVQFADSVPSTATLNDGGTRARTSFAIRELKIAVVPTASPVVASDLQTQVREFAERLVAVAELKCSSVRPHSGG